MGDKPENSNTGAQSSQQTSQQNDQSQQTQANAELPIVPAELRLTSLKGTYAEEPSEGVTKLIE